MNRPVITVDALRKAMADAAGLPLKERRQAARTLGHIASELGRADALKTPGDLDLAIEALALGASAHTYPQKFQTMRSKLMAARRAALGLADPEIAQEVAKTLDIEFGGLFVADARVDFADLLDGALHKALNRTGSYFVGFGGDGAIKVRLRVHSAGPCEPQSAEFRKLREATPEARLSCPGGRVQAHGGGRKRLDVDIPAGEWHIAAFGLGMGRRPECLVLVSPSDGLAKPLQDTPELLI